MQYNIFELYEIHFAPDMDSMQHVVKSLSECARKDADSKLEKVIQENSLCFLFLPPFLSPSSLHTYPTSPSFLLFSRVLVSQYCS
jgi:hypothetical protein